MEAKFSIINDQNSIIIKNVIIKIHQNEYCYANITLIKGIIEKIEKSNIPCQPNENDFYITPGFVNCHLHPNQLFDRGALDDLSTVHLLSGMHTIQQKTFEDRYFQSLYTLMDAIRSGSTAIYAVASEPEPVIKSFNYLNLTGAVTCFFNDQWEGDGNPPKIVNIKQVERKFSKFYKYNKPRLKIHIGSSSIQSASNALLKLINDIAVDYNAKVNIHISEGQASVESCIKNRGITPVRLLRQLKLLNPHWNLIHATSIDEEEVRIIADSGASVIHCPVSNAKTGAGIAPMSEFIKYKVTVGLGTDACSNNNTNNILNEAYFSKILYSGLYADPTVVIDDIILQWLTNNGYKILDFQQKGVLKVGAPGDLLLWSLSNPSFTPLVYGNYNSAIINNAPDLKPHTVLLDGKIVIQNYKFINISELNVQQEVNTRARRIMDPLDMIVGV